MSVSSWEIEKYAWIHSALRTAAMVSEKVGCGLGY